MNTTHKPQNFDTQRNEIRKKIRTARRALTDDQLNEAASALLPKALKALAELESNNSANISANKSPNRSIRRVAGYLAFQGEMDVSPVMDELRAMSVKTYVPMLDGETLQFALWAPNTPRTKNRFGIIEPCVPKNEWIPASELDAILVPLVAYDQRGNRMGMGGGFYDKTFSIRQNQPGPPWLLGVAHNIQQVDNVYEDWWDVKLDQVISA